jgi:hypothetical protein
MVPLFMALLNGKVNIKQIENGIKYEGDISFENNYKIKYGLSCDQNIGEIDKLAINDLEAALGQMHLSFKNLEDNKIEIPSESLLLFQQLVLPLALTFYENSLVKGANDTYIPASKKYQSEVKVELSMDLDVKVDKREIESIFNKIAC